MSTRVHLSPKVLPVRDWQSVNQLDGVELLCCIGGACLCICLHTSLLCELDDRTSSSASIEHRYSVGEH